MKTAGYCLLALLIPVLVLTLVYVGRRVYQKITRPNFKKMVEARDLEAITALLNDERPKIRRDAVLALAYLQEVDHLIRALESNPHGAVRALAARCLGDLGHPRAVQPLINALQNEQERGSGFGFGGLDIPRTTSDMVLDLGASSGEVRSMAAWALGKLASPHAMYPLIEALQDDATITAAAHSLSQYDHPDSISGLIGALQHDYWLAQVYAMDSLLHLGAMESIPHIVELMKDEGSVREVKETATIVLTRFTERFDFAGKEELQEELRKQSEYEDDIPGRLT